MEILSVLSDLEKNFKSLHEILIKSIELEHKPVGFNLRLVVDCRDAEIKTDYILTDPDVIRSALRKKLNEYTPEQRNDFYNLLILDGKMLIMVYSEIFEKNISTLPIFYLATEEVKMSDVVTIYHEKLELFTIIIKDTFSSYIPQLIIEKGKLDEAVKNTKKSELNVIFNKENNGFKVCKDLMDELDLTIDGKPNPDNKKGRAGKLIGLITAIKETPGMLILDCPTDMQLLNYFNFYLSTTYKTFSKRNEYYPESLDTSIRFIKVNFKK